LFEWASVFVMAGHSRSKNGVALLAYARAINFFRESATRPSGAPLSLVYDRTVTLT